MLVVVVVDSCKVDSCKVDGSIAGLQSKLYLDVIFQAFRLRSPSCFPSSGDVLYTHHFPAIYQRTTRRVPPFLSVYVTCAVYTIIISFLASVRGVNRAISYARLAVSQRDGDILSPQGTSILSRCFRDNLRDHCAHQRELAVPADSASTS